VSHSQPIAKPSRNYQRHTPLIPQTPISGLELDLSEVPYANHLRGAFNFRPLHGRAREKLDAGSGATNGLLFDRAGRRRRGQVRATPLAVRGGDAA
jgi:hypothetical protein